MQIYKSGDAFKYDAITPHFSETSLVASAWMHAKSQGSVELENPIMG